MDTFQVFIGGRLLVARPYAYATYSALTQVVMGVITKMMARPELPADCAFAQQLQELLTTNFGSTYCLLPATYCSLQELMRSCWCEVPNPSPSLTLPLTLAGTDA